MSMFSEYLRFLIQSRNVSISKLSKESGVERTSLHRVLTGERVLSYQALQPLVQCLELSPGEVRKLNQYFNLLFENEAVRRARDMVDGIFGRLSELPDTTAHRGQFLRQALLLEDRLEGEVFKGGFRRFPDCSGAWPQRSLSLRSRGLRWWFRRIYRRSRQR